MLEDRRKVARFGTLGLVLGSMIAIVGCGETEPPKVIDTTSQPKVPSQDAKLPENKVEVQTPK